VLFALVNFSSRPLASMTVVVKAEYLDWFNRIGESYLASSEQNTMVVAPKHVERGRSVTPRRNVNAPPPSAEVPKSIPEKKPESSNDEDKSDLSLGSCMFVPFMLEEKREDHETTLHPTLPENDQATKIRKRDPALSPPRYRGQHDTYLNGKCRFWVTGCSPVLGWNC
jgi:hypothetical protein